MKKLATIILALAAAASPLAMRAKTIQKTLPVKAFEKLEAVGALNITYIQGTPVGLKVTGEEADVAALKIKQSGRELKLCRDDKRKKSSGKLSVVITTPVLSDIELVGACHLSAKRLTRNGDIEIDIAGASSVNIGQLQGTEIDIECSGASSINADKTSAASCDVELSGASSATMGGNTGKLKVQCSGASQAKLSKLAAKTGSVSASGASRIESNITTLTKSNFSGGSSIKNH